MVVRSSTPHILTHHVTAILNERVGLHGRQVVFDAGSHLHLAQGDRSWLLDHVETILTTIARPDYRDDDPRPGRERFYRQNALTPGRWMRVVVDCNDVPSWVVTVLIQDDDPRPQQT